jgi:hypothetical protein
VQLVGSPFVKRQLSLIETRSRGDSAVRAIPQTKRPKNWESQRFFRMFKV